MSNPPISVKLPNADCHPVSLSPMNGQIQPVRVVDSTQVKTVDRALGCNFLFVLVVMSRAPSRNNSKVKKHRQYEGNEYKRTDNKPDDCPNHEMELNCRLLHDPLRRTRAASMSD